MAVCIGVDLHVRTQTVCWLDTANGELHEISLDHQRDDLRAFYSQFPTPATVGVEACGYSLWFHRLIQDLNHQLLVGAVSIRITHAATKNGRPRNKRSRSDRKVRYSARLEIVLKRNFGRSRSFSHAH